MRNRMRKNDMVFGNLGHCNHDLLAKQRRSKGDHASEITLGYNKSASIFRLKIWPLDLEAILKN
jgi:hypothetical protein